MSGEEQALTPLDKEGRRIYRETGIPMGTKDIHTTKKVEALRRADKGNPGKPPKGWWDKHFAEIKAQGNSDESTANILGDIWHHKMSDAERKAAIEKYEHSNPGKEKYHSEKTNPTGDTTGQKIIDTGYELKNIHRIIKVEIDIGKTENHKTTSLEIALEKIEHLLKLWSIR